MNPKEFKRWRKSLSLSQKEAAQALGLKRRVVQYYEKGERDGEAIAVPRYIRLACYALAQGIEDYNGPVEEPAADAAKPAKAAEKKKPSDKAAGSRKKQDAPPADKTAGERPKAATRKKRPKIQIVADTDRDETAPDTPADAPSKKDGSQGS